MNTARHEPTRERFRFSNRRTECPDCKTPHGFASIEGFGDAGKCHVCGVFLPPHEKTDLWRTERFSRERIEASSVHPAPIPELVRSTPKKLVASYPYEDENGILLYVVERREWIEIDTEGASKTRKDFCQRRPGPDGELMNGLGDVQRVLYELPSILSAIRQGHRIWIVEGEKCADALNDIFRHETGSGDRATTAPGGAGGWRTEFCNNLREADVIVWPDADAPGRKLGQRITTDLQRIARSVRLATHEGLSEFEPFNDVADLLAAGMPPEMIESIADRALSMNNYEESPGSESGIRSICMADVKPRSVAWLWKDYIPLGCLTLAEGDPSVGKTTALISIAAAVTTGRVLPDGSQPTKGPVLLLSDEDAADYTLAPRLIAAGAETTLVHLLQMEGERFVDLSRDIEQIEREIQKTGAVLLIIDPLNAYLGTSIDSHRDTSIRAVLGPLAALAERTGIAIIGVRHWGKSANEQATKRGIGSVGYTAAARSVLSFAPDPDEPGSGRRMLAVAKSNLGPPTPGSLVFRIEEYESPDGTWTTSRAVWEGRSHHSADDLSRGGGSDEERSALGDAMDFLKEELAGGRVEVKEIMRRAKDAGITDATLRRAKGKLGVRSLHDRKPGESGKPTYWQLPSPDAVDAQNSP